MEAAKSNQKVPVIGRWRSCHVKSYNSLSKITDSGKSFPELIALFSKIYHLTRYETIISLGEKISVQVTVRLQQCLSKLAESLTTYLSPTSTIEQKTAAFASLCLELQQASSLVMLAQLSAVPGERNNTNAASTAIPIVPNPVAVPATPVPVVPNPVIAPATPAVSCENLNSMTQALLPNTLDPQQQVQPLPHQVALALPQALQHLLPQSFVPPVAHAHPDPAASSMDSIIASIQNSKDKDLPGRKLIHELKLKGETKLKVILELFKVSTRLSLTGNAQTFVSRTARPVFGCFVHHFNKNVSGFLEAWGEAFKHSRFSEDCCSGAEELPCAKSQKQ
jgi:hypothetical protein